MTRVLSGLFTTAAVGAMGFACGALALSVSPEEAAPFVAPERAPAVAPVVVAAREVPETWPAVFGVIPEVAPEPEPEIAPEPVVETEPEENNTYLLTGVIAGPGIESFAMLSENDRGVVVRVGDELVGGEVVTAIDQKGVLIEFNGIQELIPVPQRDFGTMIQFDETAEAPAAALVSEITIQIETLSKSTLEELVTSAGRFEIHQGNETPGIELLSIRDGRLFDQIGLRAGDTILGINGTELVGSDLFANTPETDLLRGEFNLDILRDGARQTVKVILDQS